MATKLGRKEMPSGHSQTDFVIVGRAAKDQGDFGSDVGVADCACVNQFGDANNSKYYHGAVVKSTKTSAFYVYLEWGRTFSGQSWNGGFGGQDFQFVECSGESDARAFFAKQMASKNTKRGEWKTIGGAKIWAAKDGEDGYIVQSLATRQRGLPDAYKIKDNTGVAAPAPVAKPAATKTAKPVLATYHPQELSLAKALVGGVQTYTKAMSAAAGVTPTKDAIDQVRNIFVPAALTQIKKIDPDGLDISKQAKDKGLIDISKLVSALVPREIPRTGQSAEEAILSGGNIIRLQQDLDTFEAALKNEDFEVEAPATGVDPDSLLNAKVRWIDPNSDIGKFVYATLPAMSNNRHGYLNGKIKILNLFSVERPDRDAKFVANVKAVAAKRQGKFALHANLQPKARKDLNGEEADLYGAANVILTQHGTRSVNVSPIVQTHFRLPKSLPGALITGANFGYGTYLATDYKKAVGYSSYSGSLYGGNGNVKGRGAFMFLCDMVMGDAYRAPSTGSWDAPPGGKDSVFGVGGDRGHRLENDEHVIFDPYYNRIRYIVEFGF